MYDRHKILYYYTVEVMNRLNGLDVVDKSAWRTMDRGSWHCAVSIDQNCPKEKEIQEGKKSLKRLYKKPKKEEKWKAREKGNYIPNWLEISIE